MCGTTNAIGIDNCSGCSVPFTASLKMGHSPARQIHELASSPWRGFGDRLRRGLRLIGISWRVLKLDPELMAFPAIAGVLITLVSFFFLTGLNGMSLSALDTPQMWAIPKWQLYLLYVVIYFISIFCQAGVVAAAMLRFRGQNPRISDGFAAALRKAGPLAVWALIAATVQLILRWLEDAASRGGRAGRAAVHVVDIAWQVATYFAVPAIVFEDISGTSAVKRSGQIFKRTWAESLAGMLGMGVAFFVILLGAFFALAPLALYGGLAGVVLALVALSTLIVAMSALSAINNAALYYYATQGDAPVPYSVKDVLGNRGPGLQATPALV